MSRFKKILTQIATLLNADDANNAQVQPEDTTEIASSTANLKNPKSTKPALDNIEELKEISIGAIVKTVRILGYGKTVVSGLNFHTAFADNAVENVGLAGLIKDEDFIQRIKREFKSKGISYKNDFVVNLITQSDRANKVSSIVSGIGVEVLTPTETLKKINAKLIATEGLTWEPEYLLEPTGKTYFIGRCKDPKIENGPKIHNDIAFIGIEEKEEEVYKINNYVSRSHAMIVFDKNMGAYKIFRSKFLNNPSHKIKIYNTSLNDFTGLSLNQPQVPHVLRNGDTIIFNDKVVLEFSTLDS